MSTLDHALRNLVLPLEAEHAVISPGSRNAPVIKALIHAGYHTHSVVDERSAAFQALGMAKYLRQAVVLSCTSGTAGLNYYPAIAEAFYARIPLIVLTADRPPQAIDNWDGQAIRQKHVFSSHVRLSLETPSDPDDLKGFEQVAKDVNDYLEEEIHGPIHINIPLSEPLYSSSQIEERTKDRRFVRNDSMLLLDLDDYLPTGLEASNYLIVNGMDDGELVVVQTKDDDAYDQMVVLSDITSNQSSSVKHWDAMLYSYMRNQPEILEDLQPDVLVTTGTTILSKGLKLFLKKYKPKYHFHISRSTEIGDPFETNPRQMDPFKPRRSLESMIVPSYKYTEKWSDLSARYFQRFIELDWDEYNEFTAVKELLSLLPRSSVLHLANSMPVRYVSYLMDQIDELEVYGNRGTSGIDGCSSTALGHALLSEKDVFLISGDVAFFYDINAFYRETLPPNLKVIVLNNKGGRIFEMIDGPEKQQESLRFQLTEQHRSIDTLCSHFRLEYFCARNFNELRSGMESLKQSTRTAVLEIETDPIQNKAFYSQFKEIRP